VSFKFGGVDKHSVCLFFLFYFICLFCFCMYIFDFAMYIKIFLFVCYYVVDWS
jgi:hypothetical protein